MKKWLKNGDKKPKTRPEAEKTPEKDFKKKMRGACSTGKRHMYTYG
jgi:hypothetical protein